MIDTYKIAVNDPLESWDGFVDSHPEGGYSQTSFYLETLKKTYKLRCFYLSFFTNNILKGVFPSVLIRSFPSKKAKLISVPFSDYGGFLFEDGSNIERSLLVKALNELLLLSGARHIEIRGKLGLRDDIKKIFLKKVDCNYAKLFLEEPELMKKKFDYSVRKNIKRAKENNLKYYNDISYEKIKNTFYPMYLRKMKEFGTPPHHIKFFTYLCKNFKEKIQIFYVEYENRVVSILVGFCTKINFYISYIINIKDFAEVRSDDFVHWEMIKSAYEKGCRVFDFGVARYEGQKRYKKKWNTEFIEYSHYFYPNTLSLDKVLLFNQSGFINQLWSKYLPISLTPILGPYIRKRLGR